MPIKFFKYLKEPKDKNVCIKEARPSKINENLIEGYYAFSCSGLANKELIFNDGFPVMVFMPDKEDTLEVCVNNHVKKIRTAWISGGRTQNIYIENINRLDYILVVRFKPLLFYNFLGIDNYIFKEAPILQLDQLIIRPDWINKFIDDIYSFSDIGKKISYIDSFISSRIANNIDFPMLEYILNIIDENKGVISVSEIIKETGLNYKWLGRAFQNYIGMSPKEYLKSQRFLNSYLDLIDSDSHPLDIVANRGYYDYNHLMKDFKAYTGYTPYTCLQKR